MTCMSANARASINHKQSHTKHIHVQLLSICLHHLPRSHDFCPIRAYHYSVRKATAMDMVDGPATPGFLASPWHATGTSNTGRWPKAPIPTSNKWTDMFQVFTLSIIIVAHLHTIRRVIRRLGGNCLHPVIVDIIVASCPHRSCERSPFLVASALSAARSSAQEQAQRTSRS